MNPAVFVLLVASGALAEVTECAGGSTTPMAAPTQPTPQGAQASPDRPTIVTRPLIVEEFSSGASSTKPLKRVCMTNCFDVGSIDDEELQRDDADADFSEDTVYEPASTQTSTAGTPKPTRAPLPCTFEMSTIASFHGYCVRLGKNVGGCRSNQTVMPFVAPCHPPPRY